MFKKLMNRFNRFWYRYHRKKMDKYLSKLIGAKRYINDYMKADKKEMEELKIAFNLGETHADMESSYPRVMISRRFPLVNQPGSK